MAKRMKLPKRIAGMKIPKTIRKGPLGDFLNSSAGQLLVAEALLLAGGVFAGKRVDPSSATGELLHHPGERLGAAARSLASHVHLPDTDENDVSSRLSFAFGEPASFSGGYAGGAQTAGRHAWGRRAADRCRSGTGT
jgi:hypothetical protein